MEAGTMGVMLPLMVSRMVWALPLPVAIRNDVLGQHDVADAKADGLLRDLVQIAVKEAPLASMWIW